MAQFPDDKGQDGDQQREANPIDQIEQDDGQCFAIHIELQPTRADLSVEILFALVIAIVPQLPLLV